MYNLIYSRINKPSNINASSYVILPHEQEAPCKVACSFLYSVESLQQHILTCSSLSPVV